MRKRDTLPTVQAKVHGATGYSIHKWFLMDPNFHRVSLNDLLKPNVMIPVSARLTCWNTTPDCTGTQTCCSMPNRDLYSERAFSGEVCTKVAQQSSATSGRHRSGLGSTLLVLPTYTGIRLVSPGG